MLNNEPFIKIQDLNFGFNDAENYKKTENKILFEKIFYKTDEFNKMFDNSKYFILGEKGTGKTAYAMYLANNEIDKTVGFISYIRETDYQKFIWLKQDQKLQLSDYTNIWKVLIYLLLSQRIKEREPDSILGGKFKALNSAIDDYYSSAFSPEIIYALNFIEKSKLSASLISKYFSLLGEKNVETNFTNSRFQTNLLYIQRHFEEAIKGLTLKNDYTIFIDGIDIRPKDIPYNEYLECIKGLANATWAINNDFFSILPFKNKLKIMLLIRHDIFANLGLQNINNKIKDNSILLDWRTTYNEYQTSKLFLLTDKLLSSQQNSRYNPGVCWEAYFPYELYSKNGPDSPFIEFLRFSLYRPRDIVTMLDILKEIHVRCHPNMLYHFAKDDFENAEFQERYSNYLMGEIKDYLSFYYSDNDYEFFRKFFDFLNRKPAFNYSYFLKAFRELENYIERNNFNKPQFFETADTFLQFLYDLNIICYIETWQNKDFIRWCFRERNYSNISPKVKANCNYQIHKGFLKSLNFEKKIHARKYRRC